MAKCPGQDTRYWGPRDVSEAACATCGYMVEFFKTDGSRRCPGCGKRVTNPAVSLGCAQWCQYAKECLGFDPKSLGAAQQRNDSIAEKLIAAVKREFGADQRRIAHALLVLELAEEIMREEGGDPRVVIAAALLHDIGIQEAERKHGSAAPKYQEAEGPPIARRILEETGFGEQAIEEVCRIVGSHHTGGDLDTVEFRIVWDADNIVNLPARQTEGGQALHTDGGQASAERWDAAQIEESVEKIFRTKKGKEMGRRALLALGRA